MKKFFLTMLLVLFVVITSKADDVATMRRQVDVNHPMFIVHIDTWNYPDPEKIISLIPEDVKPWCVFNISLSISHNEDTGEFNLVRNGIETAHSWARACAEHNVWCTVQPASGGFSHFPDGNMEPFEKFFVDYPNFLGFNYCEQFWGFYDKFSVTVPERLAHFAKLMDLSVKYGGYLILSWCGGIWHFDTDPVAMFKRDANFKKVCQAHPDNLVMCFKYTSSACWYNNESVCLGTFLSGMTNNYGIRYDHCGWDGVKNKYEEAGVKVQYPTAVGLSPVMENMQLTGMTVFDGPELIWQQCFAGANNSTTSDGYTSRNWRRFSQFDNIWIDLWRKVLDGTLRIPTRAEVLEKTQLAVYNNLTSGSAAQMYAAPENLYDGLYKLDGQGNMQENFFFLKKTGRYGAIPVVAVWNNPQEAVNIPIRVTTTSYATKWNSTQAKVNEINKYAPEEYTGELYVGRMKNAWVAYNPYLFSGAKRASIPLKYNTCEKMELNLNMFSTALVHEYEDHIDFYLNNYRVDTTTVKIDEVYIHGASAEPTVEVTGRLQPAVKINYVKSWKDGVYQVRVAHNGPVDVRINCAGKATDRLSTASINEGRKIEAPAAPSAYMGPWQHEAECFDYKRVGRMVTNPGGAGDGFSVNGHIGQGYAEFGTDAEAALKDSITLPVGGTYRLKFRYCAPNAASTHIALLVNNTLMSKAVGQMNFRKTGNAVWDYTENLVRLEEGTNVIYLRANTAKGTVSNVLVDNMVLELVEPDDVETVNGVTTVAEGASQMFDIIGRQVGNMSRKGVYIQRGRKYVR